MKIPRSALAFACIAFIVGSIAPGAALAADKACTKADATKGAKAIDRINTWGDLYKAWQDYGHCDTGDVADGFTDSLLRLMVDWKAVDTLAAPMQKDAQFKAWVLARLQAASKEDRDAVYSRVKASCPKGLDSLCAELADAVRPAAK
ncbi:MAG TPA: hypothetical protein VII36_08840 [Usitatibacter sp.]